MVAPAYFDPLAALKDYLEAQWGDNEPAIADYYNACSHTWHNTLFTIHLDEFDANALEPQMLLETFPAKMTFPAPGLVKKEQRIKITVFVRPKLYDATTIEAARALFIGMKTRFDELVASGRFSMYQTYSGTGGSTTQYIADIAPGEWDDGETVIRGFDVKASDEPIQFRSSQTILAVYYLTTTAGMEVYKHVTNLLIGSTNLKPTEMKWEGTNPWVVLTIPAGAKNARQYLIPRELKGYFICHDIAAVQAALYGVDSKYAKTFSLLGTEFVVTAKTIAGTSYPLGFYDVRIEDVSMAGPLKDGENAVPLRVNFTASAYGPVV